VPRQCPAGLLRCSPAGTRHSRISGVSLLCIARNPVISGHVGGCPTRDYTLSAPIVGKWDSVPLSRSANRSRGCTGGIRRYEMIAMTHSGETRLIALSAAIGVRRGRESGEINEHGTRYGNIPRRRPAMRRRMCDVSREGNSIRVIRSVLPPLPRAASFLSLFFSVSTRLLFSHPHWDLYPATRKAEDYCYRRSPTLRPPLCVPRVRVQARARSFTMTHGSRRADERECVNPPIASV